MHECADPRRRAQCAPSVSASRRRGETVRHNVQYCKNLISSIGALCYHIVGTVFGFLWRSISGVCVQLPHRRASAPTRADERAARLGVAVKPFVTTFGAVKILGYPCHVHYADTTTVQGLL